jgi:hypothetical protein
VKERYEMQDNEGGNKEMCEIEYCEDCGCPLGVCCKTKTPVVGLAELKKYCEENKFEHKLCNCGHKGDVIIVHNFIEWAESRSKGETRK